MTYAHDDGQIRVWHGENLALLATLPDESVDAVVTDPPYAINFMGKAWDRATPGQFQHWCEQWAAGCLRVLKPGGHLLAFGAPRTVHRLAAGIEDAGFQIRDGIVWLYAQGMPKGLNVSAAVDRLDATAVRRERALQFTGWMREHLTARQIDEITHTDMGTHYVTAAAQPHVATAALFDRLRPHLPPVPDHIEALVRERTVESENEAARLVVAVDSRIRRPGTDADLAPASSGDFARTTAATEEAARWEGWNTALNPAQEPIVVARKPLAGTVAATVVRYGTGALNVDGCRVPMSPADAAAIDAKHAGMDPTTYQRRPGDSLGLSTHPIPLKLAQAHEAGRWPSNLILTHAHDSDGQDLCGHGCAAGCPVRQLDETADGISRVFPVFRFQAKASTVERPRDDDGRGHSTVKPVELIRWLIRLVVPEGALVLDPFAGSGTTAEAARAEGVCAILAEKDPDYWPFIARRLARPTRRGKTILDLRPATPQLPGQEAMFP